MRVAHQSLVGFSLVAYTEVEVADALEVGSGDVGKEGGPVFGVALPWPFGGRLGAVPDAGQGVFSSLVEGFGVRGQDGLDGVAETFAFVGEVGLGVGVMA